ncbi:hypothetical protein GCM10028805_33110 [Spirosoma harenae]
MKYSAYPYFFASLLATGCTLSLSACGNTDRITQLEQTITGLESKNQNLEWDKTRSEAEISSLKNKLSYAESETSRLRMDLQSCKNQVNSARLGLPF